MARKMICEYGMSEKLGPVVFLHRDELALMGHDGSARHDYSDETAHDIDVETRRLIDEAFGRAKDILAAHRSVLDRIAQALIGKETLHRDDLDALLAEAAARKELKRPKSPRKSLGTPQLYASSGQPGPGV